MAERKSTGASAPTYKKYVNAYNRDVKRFIQARKAYDRVHVKKDKMRKAILKRKGTLTERPYQNLLRSDKVMYRKFSSARSAMHRASRNIAGFKAKKKHQTFNVMFRKIKKNPMYWKSSFAYIASDNPSDSNDYIYFKLKTEEPQYSNQLDASSTPEKGASFTGNSEKELIAVNVDGYLGGQIDDKWRDVKQMETKMVKWFNDEDELYFQGQRIHEHTQLTSFDPQHTTDATSGGVNALSFTATLTLTNPAETDVKSKKHKTHNKGKIGKTKGIAKGNHKKHRIKRGETMIGIARMYGVSFSTLKKKNPQIKNPNLIYAGQYMHI